MSESKDDKVMATYEKVGGPACPATWTLPSGGSLDSPGMTLRDWFAGQAMAARIATLGEHYHDSDAERIACKAETAHRAYEMADAMLAERALTKQ